MYKVTIHFVKSENRYPLELDIKNVQTDIVTGEQSAAFVIDGETTIVVMNSVIAYCEMVECS